MPPPPLIPVIPRRRRHLRPRPPRRIGGRSGSPRPSSTSHRPTWMMRSERGSSPVVSKSNTKYDDGQSIRPAPFLPRCAYFFFLPAMRLVGFFLADFTCFARFFFGELARRPMALSSSMSNGCVRSGSSVISSKRFCGRRVQQAAKRVDVFQRRVAALVTSDCRKGSLGDPLASESSDLAATVTDHVWQLSEMVGMREAEELD